MFRLTCNTAIFEQYSAILFEINSLQLLTDLLTVCQQLIYGFQIFLINSILIPAETRIIISKLI